MNQAASTTGRPPAGSTATVGCCPMFSSPFFMNSFANQAPLIPPIAQQCFLGAQAAQIQQLASMQPSQQLTITPNTASAQQQPNAVQQQQPTVSQQMTVSAQSDRTHPPQRQQDHSNQSTNTSNISSNNNNSNEYNNTFTGPTLSLQHLLAGRHPSGMANCMALAAALAQASFPHFQQLQQQSRQNHHQQAGTTNSTNINQPNATTTTINNSVTTNPINSASITSTTSAASVTNQVPMINFNSYSTAPQNLITPASNAPQLPPVVAHLNQSTTNQHRQQPATSTTNEHLGDRNRPSPTNNTSVEGVDNHQQQWRVVQNSVRPQQPVQGSISAQQYVPQNSRSSTLSDETLNTLLNEQFQATMLINQILANNQSVTPLGPIQVAQHQHATAQPQQMSGTQINSARSQFSLPNQLPLTVPSSQQVSLSFAPQPRLEQVSSQATQQQFQQNTAQSTTTRMAQVPAPADNIQQTIGTLYQQQQQTIQNTSSATVGHQAQQPLSQPDTNQSRPIQLPAPLAQTQQVPNQQQPQPQTIPSASFYAISQMEQALALLANPQVATNIFGQIFHNYFQSGLRTEAHAHPNSAHFHHHLHGPHHHHHHHHGSNGQENGHDATLPVDSLAISEAKPKGLNRAEIDSLTHYIHTDEKDSRTCVICLSKFELKSKIRPLSCNHAFHAKCVDKWLRANRTCPICRRDALKSYDGKIKRV